MVYGGVDRPSLQNSSVVPGPPAARSFPAGAPGGLACQRSGRADLRPVQEDCGGGSQPWMATMLRWGGQRSNDLGDGLAVGGADLGQGGVGEQVVAAFGEPAPGLVLNPAPVDPANHFSPGRGSDGDSR
jgi:hypothetical protein